ncbi:methyl-accepting chemotaxis protein [Paenibacillus sp. S-38]|uniref:methyl-accepting chemotaxis protein n=1 Tax=Paenibacillus sp. S-38 TaxID=3416710 RepID=UPI003CEA1A46
MSHGDLTQTIAVRSRDEFGQMAVSLNQMAVNLKTTINNILRSSESVANTSGILTLTSEQTAQAVAEISESLQQVVNGTEIQNELITDTVTAAASAIEQLHMILEKTNSASTASSVGLEKAMSGAQLIKEAIERIDDTSLRTIDSVNIIRKLEEKSSQIHSLNGVLSEMAKKTKILSINAGIIASQSGSNGKAFTVVSDEIFLRFKRYSLLPMNRRK